MSNELRDFLALSYEELGWEWDSSLDPTPLRNMRQACWRWWSLRMHILPEI